MAEKKRRLLLIDANSLIHRAYHALPPLSTPKGEMVNAVYGFLSVLFKAIKEFQPTYIAAAFDVPAPTKRHKIFKEYKATREKAPDELYNQFPLVKEALSILHILTYEKEGFEADDIIGTIAKNASKANAKIPLETIILSEDRDMFQLVDQHTKVYTRDSVLYDKEKVKEKFGGIEPSQLIDYKGLRGDPADNIPGVLGIGDKTAIQLVREFRSVEELYKALESGKVTEKQVRPGLQEKLLSQKDQAFLSKELATIDKEVPLAWRLEENKWGSFSKEKGDKLLARFGFESLSKRMLIQGLPKKSLRGESTTLEKIEQLYRDKVFSRRIYELEKQLEPILRQMEKIGIKINRPYFQELQEEMGKALNVLRRKIHGYARKEFNINSTQQLSEVLFEVLALSPKGLKKTPKGVISTASPELEKLLEIHPIVKEVFKYREIQKLLTTYAKPLPLLADEKDRVHTHFDQLGTATGRISSSLPNVQNIPKQGEWGKRIREGFIAEQGFSLVSFDYSQMELRIVAHLSGDKQMRLFFSSGADIHKMTAAAVFGVSEKEVTDEMRFRAKALNFGVLYGMGAQGFAKSASISIDDARDFIEQYFVRFPKIYEYMEKAKESSRSHGYVETMFGRRRYLPEANSNTPQLRAASERMAQNHPIQGSVADIVKMAMVELDQTLALPKQRARMLLQIHDELLFEIADDIVEETSRSVKTLLENICQLEVSLQVDVKKGKNWGIMEKVF